MSEIAFYCAFCGKGQDEVEAMVQGEDMVTCACINCVGVCVEALTVGGHWPTATNAALRRGLLALAAYIGPDCTAAVETAMSRKSGHA